MHDNIAKQLKTLMQGHTRAQSGPFILVISLLGLAALLLNACTSTSDFTSKPQSNNPETAVTSNTPTVPTPNTPTITANSIEAITNTPTLATITLTPATNTPLPTTQPPTPTIDANIARNQPVQTTGCGQATSIKPGTSQNVIIAAIPSGARGSVTRSYWLHLPAKYNPNEPQAVLLVFHGHGGLAADMEAATEFSTLADQQDFIAVYPQGIKDNDNLPMWASVGPAADYGIDDLTFTNDLLDKLQKELCIDPNRIYATSFSNGGGMSNYLACRLDGRIAAVVPIAGNYFALPDGGCQPKRAVSVLEIHGTADSLIPYNGRPDKDYPGWPLPSMADFLAEWANRDNCAKGPQTFVDTKEVKGEQWSNCRDNSAVAHYAIKGGGHDYPGTIAGQPSSQVIWSFLSKHTLHP